MEIVETRDKALSNSQQLKELKGEPIVLFGGMQYGFPDFKPVFSYRQTTGSLEALLQELGCKNLGFWGKNRYIPVGSF
jgi:hypothetical protein